MIAIVYWLLVGTTFFEYLSCLSVWIVNLLYIFISLVFIDLVYAVDATLDQKAKDYPKLYILKAILSTIILATSALLCYLSF